MGAVTQPSSEPMLPSSGLGKVAAHAGGRGLCPAGPLHTQWNTEHCSHAASIYY